LTIGLLKKKAEMGTPIRLGINSEICTVGNFEKIKIHYTIISSLVNLASKLKAASNARKILVSEAVENTLMKRPTAN